jgi:hypothetical protein
MDFSEEVMLKDQLDLIRSLDIQTLAQNRSFGAPGWVQLLIVLWN